MITDIFNIFQLQTAKELLMEHTMNDTNETTALTDLSVLRFSIVLTDSAGVVVRTLHTKKVRRVHYVAQNHKWASAHLIVKYGDEGLTNEGIYASIAELQAAITAFTEPELMQYIKGN